MAMDPTGTPALLDRYRHQIMDTHPVSIRIMVAFGAAFGTMAGLPASPSDRFLDPFLLFIIPGMLLYCSAQIHRFLKKPRADSFAFILGLSYSTRRTCADRYASGFFRAVLASMGSIVAPFLILRLSQCGRAELSDSGAIAALLFIEAIGGIGIIKWLIEKYFYKPLKHDRSRAVSVIKSRLPSTEYFSDASVRLFLFTATTLSRLAPSGIRPYCRRLILYLLRRDLFVSAFVPASGLAAAGCIAVFMPEIGSTATLMASLFIPVGILFATTAACMESTERLAACPYYSIPLKSVYLVNMWMTGMALTPYCAIALISQSAGFEGSPQALAARLTSILLCCICIAAAFSYCFCFTQWNASAAAVITVTLLCVFIAAAGTAQGSLFTAVIIPAALIAVQQLMLFCRWGKRRRRPAGGTAFTGQS